MMSGLFKYVLLLHMYIWLVLTDHCPNKCTCKRITQSDGPDWVKVRCGDADKLVYVEDDDFLNIANEAVQLNLSNNNLTTFMPKVQFTALQKLDLSKNLLSSIQAEQFRELPNLRRLDISSNVIKHIDGLAFINLQHLERLKLNQNQILTIEKGTFNPINNLKQLDIANNPLKCDCELLWLLDWAESKSVKLLSNPKCETPETFKGKPLRKLKVGVEFHCKSPAKDLELPLVQISPHNSQVVFEGDSIKLQCRAPRNIEESFETFDMEIKDKIKWQWPELNPPRGYQDIIVDNRYLADSGLIDSSLIVSKLHRNHSGLWNCHLLSQRGNHSKGITIVVISESTKFCPVATTTNNKGSYFWPRTIINNTVILPCESTQLTGDIAEQKASYFCSSEGFWRNINTTKCPYISETTKILEQFSKINLTVSKGSILESAKHFKNFTADLKIMHDVMDLVFATRTIQYFLEYLDIEKDLSTLLMDVINNFLDLDNTYLLEAELEDKSCSKLVNAVESIAKYLPSSQRHKARMAIEEFKVNGPNFTGLECIWYSNENSNRFFQCAASNLLDTFVTEGMEIEASVQIPSSVFYHLPREDVKESLIITAFKDSKLFPYQNKSEEVTSAIVGVKIGNSSVTNLSEPIFIMLKPTFKHSDSVIPVWWDPSINSWTTDGCTLSEVTIRENLVFSCNHLGYYGLLQDTTHIPHVKSGAKFRFSHPAIYIGTFILFVCLFFTIMSYLFAYSAIQMPKKTKHSLVNTWLAVLLLCFMYVFGIYQTEDMQICQIVGMILHYLTLSSILWMCVGVNIMYKRLRKNDAIELQDDELPSDEPIQKPILGLYLVGWGIALIVCGISGAVNMKEYASYNHCFLSSAPALSALYIPFGILFVFLCVLFMLIRCAIYSTDANGHLSEGTQATENVDLDLLEPNFPHVDCRSVRSVSTKTASSEVEDPEHAPMAQLNAYVKFLFLYVCGWVACALATVKPIKVLPYEEDIFSVLYAIFASFLGVFTLFFYCIARNDVRTQWVMTSRWAKRKGVCFRSRNVSDATANLPQIQVQPLPPIPTQTISDLHIHSRSSSRSSAQTKSISHNSNVLKAVDLNGSTLHEATGTKINNVNLVVLHRQQYRSSNVPNLIENPTHSAEMFYNPHQSTVARKFFKKQKRNMMKRNNLSTRRTDLNSDNGSVISIPKSKPKQNKDNSNIDTNIYANNSKVNNTNIHVEKIPKNKTKHKNLNILSDSCEDLNLDIPVDTILSERTRRKDPNVRQPRTKKKQNVAPSSNKSSLHENNMRSVSQQCTLEYSSEPISDSILDQKSPEKPIQSSFNTESSEVVPSLRRENSPIENLSTLTEEPGYYNLDSKSEYYKLKKTPSDLSIVGSTSEFAVPRIYVNPSHEFFLSKRAQSRASSVSASEIEELYQQIKRGPQSKHSSSQRYVNERHGSPCISDSEINSYLTLEAERGERQRDRNPFCDEILDLDREIRTREEQANKDETTV